MEETIELYKTDEELNKIAVTSACIEGEFYGKLTRVEETIEFIKRMGYKKIGIASCVGLMRETGILTRILRASGIESYTVGCKIGAVDKTLEEWGSDFNIVVGLCVGHDTMFLRYSKVPTTVLIAKDRVLQHNPAGALYGVNTMYSRFKNLGL